jgi:hypothetical protein
MAAPDLRPYQDRWINAIRDAFKRCRRILGVSPTGSGKGVMLAWLAMTVAARAKRILILGHRQEIVDQISAALDRFGVPHGIIAAGRPETSASVQVAMVLTLANRLAAHAGAFDLVFVDECFPAGTLIDGRAIETLQPGDPVRSFSEDRRLTSVRVTRVMQRKTDCVTRLTLENGRYVVSTPEHPFFTTSGWCDAKDTKGCTVYVDPVHMVRNTNDLPNRGAILCLATEPPDLLPGRLPRRLHKEASFRDGGAYEPALRVTAHDTAQSDAESGSSRQGRHDIAAHWAQAFSAGRQWQRTIQTAGDIAAALGAQWIAEYIVPTRSRQSGLPTHYKLDLAQPQYKIAIEIDGGSHHALAARQRDRKKQGFLVSAGWSLLRFSNEDVMTNLKRCVRVVSSTISRLKEPTLFSLTE